MVYYLRGATLANGNAKHNKSNNKLKKKYVNRMEQESFCDYLRPFRNKQKLINENENFNGEEHESS